jgi:uncharacterized protein (UPF0276 family)
MAEGLNKTAPIPARPLRAAGIGLRGRHYEALLEQEPDIGFIEVHPENYFGGGRHRHYLGKARELYPLSFHAVGLSLGSDQPVDKDHLRRFRELIDMYQPFHVSDHVSWSASGNAHLHDLLPLPYTEETLKCLCGNIVRTQDFFGREILIENPSSYLSFAGDEMREWEFMNEAARRTGCFILLDVNNIYVQAFNHGIDAREYIDNIDAAKVREIHLAGHTEREFDDGKLLVDTHNRPVRDDVWELYEYAISRLGPVPTLIEWDGDIPELPVLVAESDKAQTIIDTQEKVPHAAE